MADTSMIELADLIEREACIRLGDVQGRGEKATRKGGPCPFCRIGTDRFAVFVNAVPMHYHCGIHGNGCGAHGDAITFMREYHQISYYEACERLDVDPGSQYSGPRSRIDAEDEPPCDVWQAKAKKFCEDAKDTLWSDIGLKAREYLQLTRGLNGEVIKRAGLGLNLIQGYQPAAEWGEEEDVWIVRGVVVPWRVEGQLWKVNIRRSDKDVAADRARGIAKPKRYSQISGGSDGLYGADTVRAGLPLVMCEGEIDRISLLQATNNGIAVVATGSAGAGQGTKWVNIAKQASPVLVTFDYDDNNAGDIASCFWCNRVGAVRYTPWAHDLNEMLTQGMDLAKWLEAGIELAYMEDELEPAHEKPVPAPAAYATPTCTPPLVPTSVPHPVEDVNPPAPIRRLHKTGIPQWLKPGTDEWNKQVERCGLKEMQERRAAWFEQLQEAQS